MKYQDLEIAGGTSLNGTKIVSVGHPDQTSAILPLETFTYPTHAISKALLRQGVAVFGKRAIDWITEQVSSLTEYPQMPIADASGWALGHFVLPDGTVFSAVGSEPVRACLDTPVNKCHVAGSLKAWKREVADPLTDQSIPMFAIMLAFVAPLLRLTNRIGNFGFEIVGKPASGKTTTQLAMSSVLGGVLGGAQGQYWITFNATLNGMESQMRIHSDLPLVIDETGLALADESRAKRAAYLKAFSFQMGGGMEKLRFGDIAKTDHRFAFFSSSNEPFADLVGRETDVAKAAGDRFMTLVIDPSRPFGVFDTLPEGYQSGSEFSKRLVTAAAVNHGHPIRRFLGKLVQERADDEDALRAQIEKWVAEFRERTKIDPDNGSAVRVADAFGLVYAAGRLAKKYAVLPKRWRIGPAILSCYQHQRVTPEPQQSFAELLLHLMEAPTTVHLRIGEKTSRKAIERADVFVRHRRDGRMELLIRPRAIEALVPRWASRSRRSEVLDWLIPDGDHKTRKRRLHRKTGVERMVCFKLPPTGQN